MKLLKKIVTCVYAALFSCALYAMEKQESIFEHAQDDGWAAVERMLSEGADPRQTDAEGKSLFSYWIPFKSRRGLTYLSKQQRDEQRKPENRIAWLVEKGVQLTKADIVSKASALHRCACYCPALVAQCIAVAADPNGLNKKAESPLQYCLRFITGVRTCNQFGDSQAKQKKREQRVLEGIEALVRAGTNIDTVWEKNERSYTVLSRAIDDGRSASFIKKLLELGAHPDLPSVLYTIPLIEALHHKQANTIITLLLAHKADPNLTPYIAALAARCADDETLTLLLSKGMNVNVYDEAGGCGTPLTQAIKHYRGFKRLKRVLDLLQAGASAHDGCALLEAACSTRKDDDQEGAIGLVGLLLAHQCPVGSIVKPYASLSGAMDCTRDEAPADKLYESYISVWPEGSLPSADKRIRAMFLRAKENPKSFVYTPQVLDTFNAAPTFPIIIPSACVCKSTSSGNMQEQVDRDIISALEKLIENDDEGKTHVHKKYLFSSVFPSVEGMINKNARTCALYNILRTSIANLDTFGKTYRTNLFRKLLEHSAIAFTSHASSSKDNMCSDLMLRLIKTAHKKKKIKKLNISSRFSKLIKRKPEGWQPSWRHLTEALKAHQAGVPFYLETLIPYCNLNAYGPEGQTLLHKILASDAIDVKLIKLVLDKGADPNMPNMSCAGDTALHQALHTTILAFDTASKEISIRGLKLAKKNMIKLLIARGANTHQANLYGQTPEDIMKEKERKKALKKEAHV